jgi:pimeloyl-ACP methyl ester carboxylesterase
MSRFGYLRTPTPPELLAHASPPERARVDAMLNNILTVSLRAEGLRNDTAVDKHLSAFPLESIRVPTLVISARDDRYGTYAGAKFIGFDEGGHTWVGHDDEVRAAIARLLLPSAQP